MHAVVHALSLRPFVSSLQGMHHEYMLHAGAAMAAGRACTCKGVLPAAAGWAQATLAGPAARLCATAASQR